MEPEPFVLSQAQQNHIIGIIWRRVQKWLIGGFSVLTLISLLSLVFGLYKAYIGGIKLFENILVENVSREFQTPKIKDTIEDVAKSQANAILKNQVNPEVEKFKSQTGAKVNQFEDFLAKLKQQYEKEYKVLSEEIAKLKQRNDIAQLGDRATSDASRDSFEKLEEIRNKAENADMKAAAHAEIARIKSFWSAVTRVRLGLTLDKFGEKKKQSDYTTHELIEMLLTNNDFRARVLVARELAIRKEKRVPQALLKCMETDRDLEVAKNALESYGRLTGFEINDVFDFNRAQIWWNEHSKEVDSKLMTS